MRYQAGSCVVCGQGTDTVIAFTGEAEWHVAGLQVLGVPSAEAPGVVEASTGCEPGKVPDGLFTTQVRVCAACIGKSPFARVKPVLATPGADVPVIQASA